MGDCEWEWEIVELCDLGWHRRVLVKAISTRRVIKLHRCQGSDVTYKGNGYRWNEMEGDGRRWKGGDGWTWMEMDEIDGDGWTWMELDGDGWTWMEMDGDGWRWMELDGDGWRWMEMDEMDGDGWTWMEMDEMDGDG
ncbi:unnamed protein product [Boreogadus saida]